MARAIVTLKEGQEQFPAARRVSVAAIFLALVAAVNLACVVTTLARG